jgi:hypothetical protein
VEGAVTLSQKIAKLRPGDETHRAIHFLQLCSSQRVFTPRLIGSD